MNTEPERAELLPCPFCGGTEIHIGPMDQPNAWEYWVVGCNNYDCPLDADSVKVEFGTPEKAAAAWNTRATAANLAALQAEIEALRAERDALLDALRQITEWPDGGNRYGQENIKRFAQHAIDTMPQGTGGRKIERRNDVRHRNDAI